VTEGNDASAKREAWPGVIRRRDVVESLI